MRKKVERLAINGLFGLCTGLIFLTLLMLERKFLNPGLDVRLIVIASLSVMVISTFVINAEE